MRSRFIFLGGLLALLFLSSCSAAWYLNKAVQKDPNILVQDTVVMEIPVIETDTIFESVVDTLKIEQNLDSILAELDLPEICKEIIKPVTEYITKIEFIDTTINNIEVFETDSFKITVETILEPLDNNTYSLRTKLTDIEALYSFEKVVYVKDPSWFNKKIEIFLLVILLVLLIALLKL